MSEGGINASLRSWRVKTNQVGAGLPPRPAAVQLHRGCEDGRRGLQVQLGSWKNKDACRWRLSARYADRCLRVREDVRRAAAAAPSPREERSGRRP